MTGLALWCVWLFQFLRGAKAIEAVYGLSTGYASAGRFFRGYLGLRPTLRPRTPAMTPAMTRALTPAMALASRGDLVESSRHGAILDKGRSDKGGSQQGGSQHGGSQQGGSPDSGPGASLLPSKELSTEPTEPRQTQQTRPPAVGHFDSAQF